MTYLKDTDFRDTAYAIEVGRYGEIYRAGAMQDLWDYPEMTRVYLDGHQIETFTVDEMSGDMVLSERFGGDEWERKEVWAVVENDCGELAPKLVDAKQGDFSAFGEGELVGVIGFGDVSEDVRRVALAIACEFVLVVSKWDRIEDEPEYTHSVVAAAEYGDGWINFDGGVELSLEQLFKENDLHLIRSARVVGVDGMEIEGEA